MPEHAHLLDALIYIMRGRENRSASVTEIVADLVRKDIYRKQDGTFPSTQEIVHLVKTRPDAFKLQGSTVTYIGPAFPF